MVYIDAVHYVIDSHGCEVIDSMKWTNNLNESAVSTCTKQEMIDFINSKPNCTKTKYYDIFSGWTEGSYVRVVDNKYLRTDSNGTKADNLGNLPRY
jgi:hypothetical protein